MDRTLDSVARGRFALVVALLGVASVLSAASMAPTITTEGVAVLAACEGKPLGPDVVADPCGNPLDDGGLGLPAVAHALARPRLTHFFVSV